MIFGFFRRAFINFLFFLIIVTTSFADIPRLVLVEIMWSKTRRISCLALIPKSGYVVDIPSILAKGFFLSRETPYIN
jgi:hypothetical protein